MAAPLLVVVLGTGTEVGKTHCSEAVLHAWRARRAESPRFAAAYGPGLGVKPIESGVDPARAGSSGPSPPEPPGAAPSPPPFLSDSARLAAASEAALRGEPPYRFARPLSPHLAAERAGARIDLGIVTDWVASQDAGLVLVESAGGALSPVTLALSNLDLARRLRPQACVLVTANRLGVLHDVRATTLALRALAPGLPSPILVLSSAEAHPADEAARSNPGELTRLGLAPAAVLPMAAPDHRASISAAGAIVDELLR